MGGVDETAPVSTKILHQAALAVCFLCLWITIARTTQSSRLPPVQLFWRTILTILAALALAVLILQIPGGFIVETYYTPAAPIVHVKSALLSTVLAGLGFILVQRFGHLVRFRRTRQSERNWFLMMLFVSLTFVTLAPLHHHIESEISSFSDPLAVLAVLAAIGSVVFILLNTIRLAWILRLPVKQKMGALGLGVVVVCLTSATLLLLFRPFPFTSVAEQPYTIEYLVFYSFPLTSAIILFITFGFVYALTSVLSMIFHLPTIGDYQRSVDEMAAMQALTVLVREVADPEKLHHWVVSTPVDSGRGKAAWLTIQELGAGFLTPQIVASHNIEASLAGDVCDVDAIHGEAARTRALVSIQNTSSDRRIQNGKTSGIMSLLAIPLTTRTEVLGTLFVSRDVAHAFENEDIESIGVFASQATLVLENARLLEAQFERERLASELAIAHDVQRRLLPQTMPRFSTLSLAASSTAAQEVGGDYYDLLELGDGKLAFIIADVSGKGTSAAFYMAEMQGIFQAVAQITPDPHDFSAT